MGKLLTELNRTGHDCFGHRAVPWMCNLKYDENGNDVIIPFQYKEAATYPPTSRDSRNKDGILANLEKNIAIERKKRELRNDRGLNTPEKPRRVAKSVEAPAITGPIPPIPAPMETVRPKAPAGIPERITLNDDPPVPGTPSMTEPKPTGSPTSTAQGRPPLPAFMAPGVRAMLPSTGPETPPPSPTPAPATKPEEPKELQPTKLPPSQRQVKDLGFRPQMTQSGLQFVGPGKDGASQTVYSPEEFEEEYGAYYKGQMISTGQTPDPGTYWGQIRGATQDVGFDENGKIVTYVKIPGPDGQVRVHRADKTGALVNPLKKEDGAIAFSDEEINDGLALYGWRKTNNGLYVNRFSGEMVTKEQYMHILQNPNCIKSNQVQDNFRCNVVVDDTMMGQGTFSGIMAVPYTDPTTHELRYMCFSAFKKDKNGNALQVPLGNDYNHLFNGFLTRHQYSSDLAGADPSQAFNRFYDPTDPNGAAAIPVMTDSLIGVQIMSEHPELSAIPTHYTVDEDGRVTACYTDEKGDTEYYRLPSSASNIIPVGARDYGYRKARPEELEKYGLPSGTVLHMTQDQYGNRKIEAQDSAGNKYGTIDSVQYNQAGDELSRRYYTDPYAPQDTESDTNDKWSQVLKYVMLGLPIGLALGLVGWGITGGKGNLGSALLGGAGLGATLGGLGAYSGLLGNRQGSDDDEYEYGSAMNAGY